MPKHLKNFYEFGPFRLDPQKHRLLRDGERIHLSPKSVEALLVLVQNAGKMLEREALMQAVWTDTFVEDANLTVAISHLRKALGQNGETAEYIETIPRVGYRFVAEVRETIAESAPLILEKHTLSRTVIEEEDLSDATAAVSVAVTSKPVLRITSTRTYVFVAAVLSVVTVGGIILTPRLMRSASPSEPQIKSLAVLPFKVVGGDSGNDHEGVGMADVLITRLSNIREINVRPTSSVMAFDRPEQDSISAGRKLGVDAVLEGTIYRANNQARITARLVRISDQSPLWATQFEKPLQDEFRMQDDIAVQLVEALSLNLSGGEKNALTKRYSESSDAFELYLKGRYHWNKRNWEGMIESERLFRNAIERDPNFALAYVGLADRLATDKSSSEASLAVQKALELDPNLAEAHATLGFINTFHEWKWREAEDSFKRSIQLNPGYATAHHWYATLLEIEGRNEEAKAQLRRALEIDPLSYNFLADLGQAYYFAHEYDQAKDYCRKALDIYPDFIFAHEYLSDIYLQTGDYDAAVEERLIAKKIGLTFAHMPGTQQDELEKLLDRNRQLYRTQGLKAFFTPNLVHTTEAGSPTYGEAKIHALLGDKEEALRSLELAFQVKNFAMPYVKVDPVFDKLHDEPRYQTILKKMNL
ncbi:MAG: winged helix-turn-helix domain-containing protein [Acidobacteriota bacterium]|nr:winged helix-turn-helix domain-containing protein [Acidobacteriota bacterium]